jgi:hypothetical protein
VTSRAALFVVMVACGRSGFRVAPDATGTDAAKLDCSGARPRTTVAPAYGAGGVTVDDTYVYWADSDNGMIVRTLKTGGGAPEVVVAGQLYPNGLLVVGSSLYWTNWGDSSAHVTAIGSTNVTTLATNLASARGIVSDGTELYIAVGGTTGLGTSTEIDAVSTSGGGSSLVVAGLATGGIALAGTELFFPSSTAGTISRYDLSSRVTTTIVTGLGAPLAVAVDATDVYWTDLTNAQIAHAPRTGGATRGTSPSTDVTCTGPSIKHPVARSSECPSRSHSTCASNTPVSTTPSILICTKIR